MKWLKFDEVEHYDGQYNWTPRGAARYAIDWSSNEEFKYKIPLVGVYVYEHGKIVIHNNGYRNPDWRAKFHRLIGMEFALPTQFPTFNFFTPEGKKVLKKDIMADILLYDEELQRVYFTNWQKPVTLLHPNAQPVPTSHVPVRIPNLDRAVEMREQLEPYINYGRTLNGLGVSPDSYFYGGRLSEIIKERKLPTMESSEGKDLSMFLVDNQGFSERALVGGTSDFPEETYLLVREK